MTQPSGTDSSSSNLSALSNDSALSRERRLQLDKFCVDFESGWTEDSASRTTIDQLLHQADQELKPFVVRELVAIECEFRASEGEAPSRDEYLERFPVYHDEVVTGFELWQTTAKESEAATAIPKRIGDFRVLREIGRGGMGIVYEAEQESLGRCVAIKTLLVGPSMLRPESARRFEREARAVAKLHHANIVDVYGTGIHGGIPYFAMEFVEGISLRDVVREAQSQSKSESRESSPRDKVVSIDLDDEKVIAGVGLQVASALQYAHEKGVLHRDVKPANLIVDDSGVVWVTDFGLAKLAEDKDEATKTGDVIGTLRYLPPEALKGEWDERGDIYSLGMTLYELLVLEPAYIESKPFELMDRIRQGEPLPRPSERGRVISKDLETIVMKAIAFEPSARYQSGTALVQDLRRFVEGEPIHARQPSPLERLWKWSQRKPALAAFCALVACVLFIGLPLLSLLWLRSEKALADARSMQEQLATAKDFAESSAELAITENYASSMQLAHTYLEQGRVLEANALLGHWVPSVDGNLLEETPANTSQRNRDRRGWEWHYLHNQLDTSRLTLMGHSAPYIHFAAIRPDDRQIATVGGSTVAPRAEASPGEVILWDAETGEQQRVLPGSESGVFGCAYSPDGKRIATISMRREESLNLLGEINIWDVESGKRLNSRKLPGTHDKYMHAFFSKAVLPGLRYSSDGEYLISWPKPVEVRNAETLELIWSDELAHCAIELPNDRLFISSRKPGDQIVDIRNGEVYEEREAEIGRPVRFDVAATASGEKVSAYDGQSLVVWNTSPLKARSYSIDRMELHWGAIHPSGTMLVCADRMGVLQLIALKKNGAMGAVNRRLGHGSIINHGAFSSDGEWMVTTSSDGTAKVWDIHGDRHKSVTKTEASASNIADLVFSADSTRIQYASRRSDQTTPAIPQNRTGWLSLHDPGEVPADQKFNLDATYFAHWPRTDFAFSSDGQFLAAPAAEDKPPKPAEVVGVAKSGRVNIWRSENYELLGGFDVRLDAINSIKWSDDSNWLAVAGIVDDLAIVKVFPTERFRLADGAGSSEAVKSDEFLEAVCEIEIGQPVTSMSWYGPTLRRNSNGAGVSGKALAAGAGLPESASSAVPLTNPLLATANQEKLTVWELKKENEQFTANRRNEFTDVGYITFLDFSPDGKQLAAAVVDQTVTRVYDMSEGELEYETSAPLAVGCVRFSPDGTRLAMTGNDSLVFLCEANSGRMLVQLIGSELSPGTISINPRVIFSSDGRHIATNNWRGEITVWDAGPGIGD